MNIFELFELSWTCFGMFYKVLEAADWVLDVVLGTGLRANIIYFQQISAQSLIQDLVKIKNRRFRRDTAITTGGGSRGNCAV